MRTLLMLPLLLATAMTLVGCEHNFDAVAKLNELPFGGTNDANIAAMVANPADLVHGHGQEQVGSGVSAGAIQRLESDHDKKLLNSGRTESGRQRWIMPPV